MLARFRPRRPNHATVAAYAALFIALGGTAWAAATIGPAQIKNDAVRSRHVKAGAVGNADLGAGSVATGKVQNGSLLRQDFRAGQLPPAVPPTEPVRRVKEPSGEQNCPSAIGEFCFVGRDLDSGVDYRWRNFGHAYAPAGFYKDRSGIVHLQGSIESTASGVDSAAFILPPGYRPTGGARWFSAWNESAPNNHGGVRIWGDGRVQPDLPDDADYLSLDGIAFRP